jgi:hypothetical protein
LSEPGTYSLTEQEGISALIEDSSQNVLKNLINQSESIDNVLIVEQTAKDIS